MMILFLFIFLNQERGQLSPHACNILRRHYNASRIRLVKQNKSNALICSVNWERVFIQLDSGINGNLPVSALSGKRCHVACIIDLCFMRFLLQEIEFMRMLYSYICSLGKFLPILVNNLLLF